MGERQKGEGMGGRRGVERGEEGWRKGPKQGEKGRGGSGWWSQGGRGELRIKITIMKYYPQDWSDEDMRLEGEVGETIPLNIHKVWKSSLDNYKLVRNLI